MHPLYKDDLLIVLTEHLDDYFFLLSELSIEKFKAVLCVTPKKFLKINIARLLSFFDIEKNKTIFDCLITPYLEDLIFKKIGCFLPANFLCLYLILKLIVKSLTYFGKH